MRRLLHHISPELAFILLFCSSFGFASIAVQYHTASTELHITAKSLRTGIFQIYWSDTKGVYTEQQSKKRQISTFDENLVFPMTFKGKITSIRIDPLKDKGRVSITSAVLYQPFKKPVDLFQDLNGDMLIPLQQGQVSRKDNSIVLRSEGNDPAFELPVNISSITAIGSILIIAASLIVSLVLYLLLNQRLLKGNKRAGTLSITLENSLPLVIPTSLSNIEGCLTHSGRETHRRYVFPINDTDNGAVSTLIAEVIRSNPRASAVFHYNRTGEV